MKIQLLCFFGQMKPMHECAVEEWSHYKPTSITLEEYMNGWLPGLNQDELLVGVNWNAKLIGIEVEPSELIKELEEICGK